MRSDNASTAVINTVFTPVFAVLGVSNAAYVIDTEAIQKILQDNEGSINLIAEQIKERTRVTQVNAQDRARIAQVQWEKDKPAREKAETARIRAKEIARAEMLAQVKSISQKICISINGNMRNVAGVTYQGDKFYGAPRGMTFYVTGFTENFNGQKIQIRISGIQHQDINGVMVTDDDLGGDVNYRPNMLVWDDPAKWQTCN